ncbi:peptidylprolyl isomerase [Paenibacillus sp. YN15]|uniref:peptidylprolyl isomerase n=1 Tax=Paenibacillus sp. YN15 TaxID=1742774 RepID=UPI000DCB1FAA|nr:peptidylprolyl isomerase [Paenibacillus sp. YN15]RAV01437.1 peptidylprolyl isomerase [Paenibacillus sp. YN15]
MKNTSLGISRIWMVSSFVLLAALIIYIIIYPPGKSEDATVAKVNGTPILKSQLYSAMVKAGGPQTLETMISEELVKQESDKANIQVTDADLDKEVEQIKKSFSSDEEFTQALATYNMTLESLKEDMYIQVQLRKLLEPQVKVTDEEIKTYYDTNLESMKTPEEVRASHILVATKEEAEAVLASLQGGADFATLAKEKSTDTGSKEAGGDLDFFAKGIMEEPFETAAFALKTGELSSVVETSHGFHVIKATDHKDATTPTLEEKTEEIRQALSEEQISTLSQSWLQEKRAAASVESFLE